MLFNERGDTTLNYPNYDPTGFGHSHLPGKISGDIRNKISSDWNDIKEVGLTAKEKVGSWFKTGFHKLREVTTPFTIQVESEAKRAVNKIHAVADPKWGLYRKADTTLSPELASRIRRLAIGNQDLIADVKSIQSQILTYKSLETVTQSQKQAFEALIIKLERLNYTAVNTAGTVDQVDAWLIRAIASAGRRNFLDSASEATSHSPLSLVDQATGSDRFSVQGIKNWFNDQRYLLSSIGHSRTSTPTLLPTSGSGASTPPPPNPRPKRGIPKSILLGLPIVLASTAAVFGGMLYAKYQSETTQTRTLKAAEPNKPDNMPQEKANEWDMRIIGDERKAQVYKPSTEVDLSIKGKAQSLAVDVLISDNTIYLALLNNPQLPDNAKAGLKDMRDPENKNPRRPFDYKNRDHRAIYEILTTGLNLTNGEKIQQWNLEYNYNVDKIVKEAVDATYQAGNITNENDLNNPLITLTDSSGLIKTDFVYKAGSYKPLVLPQGATAVVAPGDSEYSNL